MPANEAIPYYEPGQRITGQASAAVTGKRFLKVSGNRVDGNVRVAHADAEGRAFGVASHDTASGAKVAVLTGGVVPVLAAEAIDAFEQVEVGATGKAAAHADGFAVGVAVTGCDSDEVCEVQLYVGGYLDTDTDT